MRLPRVIAIAFITAGLLTPAAQAASGPYAPGGQSQPRHQQPSHQHNKHPRWNRSRHPRQEFRRHRAPNRSPQYKPPRYGEPVDHHQIYRERYQRQQGLPPERKELRHKIQRNRHRLNRGPQPPRHVQFIPGRPLPHGSSFPVPSGQARHLPHYPGYEWRRAGDDLLLINIADRVIYTVIDQVLN